MDWTIVDPNNGSQVVAHGTVLKHTEEHPIRLERCRLLLRQRENVQYGDRGACRVAEDQRGRGYVRYAYMYTTLSWSRLGPLASQAEAIAWLDDGQALDTEVLLAQTTKAYYAALIGEE